MTIQTVYDQVLANQVDASVWRVYEDVRDVVISYWVWRIRRSEDGVSHYLREDMKQLGKDLDHDRVLQAEAYDSCYRTLERLNGYTNIGE